MTPDAPAFMRGRFTEQPTSTDLSNAAVFASGADWTGVRWHSCERVVIVSVCALPCDRLDGERFAPLSA